MLYCTSAVPCDAGSKGLAFPDTKVVGTRGGGVGRTNYGNIDWTVPRHL